MAFLTVGVKDGFTIIALSGQFIGGDETDQLRNTLNEIIERPGLIAPFDDATANLTKDNAPKILLDMSGVSYLNSTALSVLISAHRNIDKQGGQIALCKIGKNIENVFVQTKLILVFSIFANVDDAIKELA